MQWEPDSALFEINGKTPTDFQWEVAQTLIACICAPLGIRYDGMQCMQTTITNGNGLRTLDMLRNEGEEVKFSIMPHQTFFLHTHTLFMGMQQHWKQCCICWWPPWQCVMIPSCCPQLCSSEQNMKCSLGEICCNLLSSFLYL